MGRLIDLTGRTFERLRVKYRNGTHLKHAVIAGYGGHCQCEGGCREWRYEFLTIDHVNNDGNILRRQRKHKEFGFALYKRLIMDKFPKEYRLSCWNCNMSRGHYGICPHVIEQSTTVIPMTVAGGM